MPKEIDTRFQINFSEKSSCNCLCTNKETVTYEMQIRIDTATTIDGEPFNQFWVWFKPRYFKSYSKPPETIGVNVGRGERTLKEAINKAYEARVEFINKKS